MAVVAQDSFDSSLGAIWTSSAFASVVSGRARLAARTDYAGRIATDAIWPVRDAVYTIEAATPPGAGGTSEFGLEVVLAANTDLWGIEVSGTDLTFTERVGGSNDRTTITYDPSAHKWWRLRFVGNVVNWETSPDNATWTTRRTKTVNGALSVDAPASVLVWAGYFGGGPPSPAHFEVDNFQIAAAGPFVVAAFGHSGNPTTAPTGTLPTTQAGDIITVAVTDGNTNTGPGSLTGTSVSTGGLTWAKKADAAGSGTTMHGSLWWARATGNHAGQTVIAATNNSGALAGVVIRNAVASGDPFGNASAVGQAAATVSTSGFTTPADDCLLLLALCEDDDVVMAGQSVANVGTMVEHIEAGSTGGNDTLASIATRKMGAGGATGNFSWTGGTSDFKVSIVASLLPFVDTPDPSEGEGALTGIGELAGVGETPEVDPAEGVGGIAGVGGLVGVGESPAVGPPEGSGALEGVGQLAGVGETPAVPPAEGSGSLDGIGELEGVGETPIVPAAEGAGTIDGVGQLLGVGETPEIVVPSEGTGSVQGIGRLRGVGKTPIPPLHIFRRPTQTPGTATVRLQALDGMWETVGADRLRGVRAEGLTATATRWGSDTCRFTLKRQPGGVFPDLSAFTPIEIYNQYGTLVWTGRIKETPSSSGDEFAIGVEGQGWHYHLDDDVFERVYVHSRLSDWKDARSLLTSHLPTHPAYGQVATDAAITLTIPTGSAMIQNTGVAATIDLGPDSGIRRVVAEVETSANSNGNGPIIIGHDTEAWTEAIGREDYATGASLTSIGAAGVLAGTTTNPHRYVTLLLWRSGANDTASADNWIKFKSVKLFRDPAHESGNQSILTARDIVRDAVQFAPLLSQDLSLIDPGNTITFPIPDFAMTDDRKPREAMEAANTLHNYTLKVLVDGRVKLAPLPDKPLFRVGAWSGADYKDASKNSGEDIYNRSIVKGTGADGAPCKVSRYASQQPDVLLEQLSTPAFPNPSFTTNTSGWTVVGGTFDRLTADFDTSPACAVVWRGLGGVPTSGDVETTLSGTFEAGIVYVIQARIQGIGAAPQVPYVMHLKTSGGAPLTPFATEYIVPSSPGGGGTGPWFTKRISFTPGSDLTGVKLRVAVPILDAGYALGIDSFEIYRSQTVLPDRRTFIRSHVHSMSQAIIPEIAQQIADTFLATHKRTPLKGDITVKGRGGVRRYLGDASVPPSELLIHTGELVHLAHQVDPGSGALGRDAPIDSVTWSEDDDTAAVSLDSQRDNLAALLARYDLVAGNGGR